MNLLDDVGMKTRPKCPNCKVKMYAQSTRLPVEGKKASDRTSVRTSYICIEPGCNVMLRTYFVSKSSS